MPGLVFANPPNGQYLTGFMSKHLGPGQYNQDNQGIGYQTPGGLMMGVYKNSINKPSAYLAQELTTDPKQFGPVAMRLGAVLGGVTGYGHPITPIAMPEVTGTVGGNTLALGLVPPVKGVTPATLALQLRKQF